MKILNNYLEFIKEATSYELSAMGYVLCKSNFRGISPVKDKFAKIVKRSARRDEHHNLINYYLLEFEQPLIDRRSGQPIETNTIEINGRQIRNLESFSETNYKRYLNGYTMRYNVSGDLYAIIGSSHYLGKYKTFNRSYFDFVDKNTISYLDVESDRLVPPNEKYTSELRKSYSIFDFLKDLNEKISDGQTTLFLNNYYKRVDDYQRKKDGFILKYDESPIFKYIISTIGFNRNHEYYDISYFNIQDENSISFLSSDKNDGIPISEKYTTKLRQTSKIGRILKKLNDEYTERQIEEFGTNFKAQYKILKGNVFDNLSVVTGNAIVFWYNSINYASGGGTLNSSCMRHEYNQKQIEFYAKHPDKIALCILLDSNNKLVARAIIWKLDIPEGAIFMDRIYYVLPEHEMILNKYAMNNGINTKKDGYHNKNKMEVHIPYFKDQPYLDTFYYDSNKKIYKNY